MKAISIWQPWASAIAVGSKHYETRSWQLPKWIEGQVVAIHASKRWQSEEREWAETLHHNGFKLGFNPQAEMPPLGRIVAIARLTHCIPTEILYGRSFAPIADWNDPGQVEYQLGNFEPGRFAWKLEDVVKLDPIPCIGRQGFWNLEQEVERAVREQAIVDVCPFSGRICRPECSPSLCWRAA